MLIKIYSTENGKGKLISFYKINQNLSLLKYINRRISSSQKL